MSNVETMGWGISIPKISIPSIGIPKVVVGWFDPKSKGKSADQINEAKREHFRVLISKIAKNRDSINIYTSDYNAIMGKLIDTYKGYTEIQKLYEAEPGFYASTDFQNATNWKNKVFFKSAEVYGNQAYKVILDLRKGLESNDYGVVSAVLLRNIPKLEYLNSGAIYPETRIEAKFINRNKELNDTFTQLENKQSLMKNKIELDRVAKQREAQIKATLELQKKQREIQEKEAKQTGTYRPFTFRIDKKKSKEAESPEMLKYVLPAVAIAGSAFLMLK